MAGDLNSGCAAATSPVQSWEYKVAITSTNASPVPPDVHEAFRDGLAKQGWIFVSENQGIFHFRRLKRQSVRGLTPLPRLRG
jgi:hypothetical protein